MQTIEPINHRTVVFPVKRVAARRALTYETLVGARDGALWLIQQAVADCRFKLAELAVDNGMVPLLDQHREQIYLDVYVGRDHIAREAGVNSIPCNMHEVVTYRYEPLPW